MIFRGLVCTFFFLGLCGVAGAQGADARAEMTKYVNGLMALQVASMTQPPPGISVEAKEVAKEGNSGQGLTVQYHVFIKGLPQGVLITESQLPVEGENLDVVMSGVSVGKDGVLMCAGRAPDQCSGNKPDDPVEFTFQPLKGEPYRLFFDAEPGKTRVGLMIVPDPVEAKSKGCTLNAVRLNRTFQLAFLYGDGYPPDTDVHYRFEAENKSEQVVHSDAKGVIRTAVLAFGNGKKGGRATVEITDKACSPKISYEWGNP
jgi:hypothetical protein